MSRIILHTDTGTYFPVDESVVVIDSSNFTEDDYEALGGGWGEHLIENAVALDPSFDPTANFHNAVLITGGQMKIEWEAIMQRWLTIDPPVAWATAFRAVKWSETATDAEWAEVALDVSLDENLWNAFSEAIMQTVLYHSNPTNRPSQP